MAQDLSHSPSTGIKPFVEYYDTSDAFYKLIEAKVRHIQDAPTSELATKIQKAIAENLKYFLREVGKLEPLFAVSELIQVGSFAEGTKIHIPDEFDFLAVVDALSKEGTVTIEHNNPGNVSVYLAEKYSSSTLTKLCEERKVNCFKGPSLSSSFSGPVRFGTIFVQTVQNAYTNKVFEFSGNDNLIVMTPLDMEFVGGGGLVIPPVDGIPMLLKKVEFKTPNILLDYKCRGLSISIDLSPAIRYHKIEDCIASKNCTNSQLMDTVRKHGSVLLVGDKYEGFRITVTECEVKYMQDLMKKQHKLLYILLKYICHALETTVLCGAITSYMLKQTCFHHDAKCQLQTDKCLDCLQMITEDLITYCTEKHMPSVLNKDVDLFNPIRLNNGRDWHYKLHFIISLRLICQRCRNIHSIDEFEAVLNDSINQLAKKFTDYHDSKGLFLDFPFHKLPYLSVKEKDGLYCPFCDEKTESLL